nr:hypothetical protein [Thiobacillus sp. 63-78]
MAATSRQAPGIWRRSRRSFRRRRICSSRPLRFSRSAISLSSRTRSTSSPLRRLRRSAMALSAASRSCVVGEFGGALGQLRGGGFAAQLRFHAVDFACEFCLLGLERRKRLVERRAFVAQRVQPGAAEAHLLGRGKTAAAPFAQVALPGDPVFAARQLAARGDVLDAAGAFQRAQQPFRHRAGKAHHFEQRSLRRQARVHAFGDDEVAVALFFAERHRAFGVAAMLQQHDVGERCERGLDRRLPARIDDFDDVGEQVVGDVGGAQRLAESRHVVRVGAAAGGEVFQHFVELGPALLQAGDADQQIGTLRFEALDFAGVGDLAAGRLRLFFQALLLLDDRFPAAEFVVDLVERLVLDFFVVVGGMFAQQRLRERGIERIGIHFLHGAFGAPGAPVAALGEQGARGMLGLALQQAVFQTRTGFADERDAFLVEALPLAVAVDLLLVFFEIVAERFELVLAGVEFARGVFLVVARFQIAVEHVLVAEHLEYQIEQFARRQFAQLVGLPLFEREHAGDGGRQAGAVQDALVVAHAEFLALFFELGQGDFAVGDPVFARPVAAFFVDAAGERDAVAGVGQAERAAAGIRHALVVDHPAQPAEVLAVASHVALVVALFRAVERQQGAQRVEQRGLARAVGAGDGDDRRVERQPEAAPEIPVHGFELEQAEHQDASSGVATDSSTPRCLSRSDSAPSRMRGANSA